MDLGSRVKGQGSSKIQGFRVQGLNLRVKG